MSVKEKKENEKKYTKLFLSLLFKNENKQYSIETKEPPEPDILLKVYGKKIGIEVSSLIREDEVEQDNFVFKFIQSIKEKFEKKSELKLNVDFITKPLKLTKFEVEELAIQLSKRIIVETEKLRESDQFSLEIDNDLRNHNIKSINPFTLK